jgi:hypothetical protein
VKREKFKSAGDESFKMTNPFHAFFSLLRERWYYYWVALKHVDGNGSPGNVGLIN